MLTVSAVPRGVRMVWSGAEVVGFYHRLPGRCRREDGRVEDSGGEKELERSSCRPGLAGSEGRGGHFPSESKERE